MTWKEIKDKDEFTGIQDEDEIASITLPDLIWYLAIACDELSISLEDVMKINTTKLQSRYKDKFNEIGIWEINS